MLKKVLRGKPCAPRAPDLSAVEPLPSTSLSEISEARRTGLARSGASLLGGGAVAAFTAAGGQGTRLGFPGPKGAFPIGPVTERSLFQVYAESLLYWRRRVDAKIPWIIMTSEENHEDTLSLFAAKKHYGLDPGSVSFVPQRSLPVFDEGWKMLNAAPDRILTAPDGHGGFFRTLDASGLLSRFEACGITTIFYFQVDNPLLQILDPVFLGLHRETGSKFSTKVVEKTGPGERMGVLCRLGGHLRVVEYTEMDEENAGRRDAAGRLVLWAGNVANHVIDVAFARTVAAGEALPLHPTHRSAPVPVPEGASERKVWKLETFVFDALPLDPGPLVLETRREEEFGPVKSVAGKDTPETCRRMLSAKYARWLAAAGHALPEDAGGQPRIEVEISPRTAAGPEDLRGMRIEIPASGPLVL
jgi:UDP-N-acetylglucosamine/UDP-N-acetylgalactosamine diphosphorylase